MNRTQLIRKIKSTFPSLTLVAKGEDYGWSEGCILIGAEDGTALLDYWWPDGPHVDSMLDDIICRSGWHLEWQDPGTCHVFDDRPAGFESWGQVATDAYCDKGKVPCPSCKWMWLRSPVAFNQLSRMTNEYVCEVCYASHSRIMAK